MNTSYLNETIAAVATPPGKGAVAIVRLSGEKSVEILSKIFLPKKSTQNIYQIPPRNNIYGKIINEQNKCIDDVLVCIFKKPSSFTGEDIVEIYCHGNDFLPYIILDLIIKNGARTAERGEFSKRAFLNGKIDLTQAEAINEIIEARNVVSIALATSKLQKNFSNVLSILSKKMTDIISMIEVNIDFPEDEIPQVDLSRIINYSNDIISSIENILEQTSKGKILKRGAKIVITGKTNVGKSQIFNYLYKEDRAIVSDYHGTTRDFIEEEIMIRGLPITIVDTAGIRETEDPIENIGKNLTLKLLTEADLILFVLDNSTGITDEDSEIFNIIKNLKYFIVINKSDLPSNISNSDLESLFGKNIKPISISAISGNGFESLETEIEKRIVGSSALLSEELITCNMRQENIIKVILEKMKSIGQRIYNIELEFLSLEYREVLNLFGELTGEVTSDDILNNIFSNFCIGK